MGKNNTKKEQKREINRRQSIGGGGGASEIENFYRRNHPDIVHSGRRETSHFICNWISLRASHFVWPPVYSLRFPALNFWLGVDTTQWLVLFPRLDINYIHVDDNNKRRFQSNSFCEVPIFLIKSIRTKPQNPNHVCRLALSHNLWMNWNWTKTEAKNNNRSIGNVSVSMGCRKREYVWIRV